MRLVDLSGPSRLSLTLLGYEFPALTSGADHHDLNWLNVKVACDDGVDEWRITGAVLQTTEVRALEGWMRDAADGRVEVGAQVGWEFDDGNSVAFIEPYLAFSVGSYPTDSTTVVRAHLPPPDGADVAWYSRQIDLQVDRVALRLAADELDREALAFPVRT